MSTAYASPTSAMIPLPPRLPNFAMPMTPITIQVGIAIRRLSTIVAPTRLHHPAGTTPLRGASAAGGGTVSQGEALMRARSSRARTRPSSWGLPSRLHRTAAPERMNTRAARFDASAPSRPATTGISSRYRDIVHAMPDRSTPTTTPLYVRLPPQEARKLDRAAHAVGAPKKDLVAGLVA